MQTAWFSKPVVVSVGVAGGIRNLSNTQQAIELLTTHWRDAGSLKHQSALRACRRAMSRCSPTGNRGGVQTGGSP
ncbi:DUF982 domain-containing protein [Mesorhizobium sp. CO1-1-11]|uniref:DUF982 domain-containing protein n=1 Tax=Mesorhizobium sp. CO1-1-11 TaxID=2876636 RepID=UPI001CCFAD46|nr:DUF982 domain-containing protein [Mesorhizobium sp. CO1-1-11]MBZ9723628.1 DUF982 domain-containing protein [Mesorhizobium sp. CO1-1-11]